jgi:recombinational DNA repair protein RecR
MNNISDLSGAELKAYAERGIIRIVNDKPIPTRIEQTPEYQKHKHLAGHPIHVSEASRKYEIAHQTLSRYANKGIIKKLKRAGNKTMLDESYVAYVAEVFKSRDGQGKWMFDKDGLPYVPTTNR